MSKVLLYLLAKAGMRVDAMLVSYTDESGHSADSRIVAMGGLVGSHTDMGLLSDRWKAMLERHHIPMFHMSELEGSCGIFEGWSESQRRELLLDVFACMHGLFFNAFGAAVIVEQYRELPDVGQEMLGDPWFLCFQLCVHHVSGLIMARLDDPTPWERIAFFHDQQREYQGRAVSAFQFMKDFAAYGKRLGTCTPASKTEVLQLQAADLVVYEIRKLIENAIYQPAVPTRWPMKQIQKWPFVCDYLDFAGKVPLSISGGPISAFRRCVLRPTSIGVAIERIEEKLADGEWKRYAENE